MHFYGNPQEANFGKRITEDSNLMSAQTFAYPSLITMSIFDKFANAKGNLLKQ